MYTNYSHQNLDRVVKFLGAKNFKNYQNTIVTSYLNIIGTRLLRLKKSQLVLKKHSLLKKYQNRRY